MSTSNQTSGARMSPSISKRDILTQPCPASALRTDVLRAESGVVGARDTCQARMSLSWALFWWTLGPDSQRTTDLNRRSTYCLNAASNLVGVSSNTRS